MLNGERDAVKSASCQVAKCVANSMGFVIFVTVKDLFSSFHLKRRSK